MVLIHKIVHSFIFGLGLLKILNRFCCLFSTRLVLFEFLFAEALFKFLDVGGNKLDYRRYGEALLEILIAGGLLG